MEIKQLDQRTINDAMHRSASRNDVTSWHNFEKGWRAAIRFAKRVEDAEHLCTQCHKPLPLGDIEYDSEGNPFCKKCYDKLFNND